MAKLLLLGDGHLRTKRPRCRTDADFEALCLEKFAEVAEIAKANECVAILQAGDLFDSPRPSMSLLAGVYNSLVDQDFEFLCIHGQHDLLYHSDQYRGRSALAFLDKTLPNFHALDYSGPFESSWGKVYGQGFGQARQKPRRCGKPQILIAHVMVGDKPLYPGHDLTSPEVFAKKAPGYALYLLGDYHYPYVVSVDGGVVVNCGAMLRLTADARDMARVPHVQIATLVKDDCDLVEEIIKTALPSDEVFDLSKKTTPKEQQDFTDLTDRLRSGQDVGVDFHQNLVDYMDDKGTPEDVRAIALSAVAYNEGEGD